MGHKELEEVFDNYATFLEDNVTIMNHDLASFMPSTKLKSKNVSEYGTPWVQGKL